MSGQFLPGARVSQIVRAYLLSFFNKFLQGEDDHLLDGPSPAYPEVIAILEQAPAFQSHLNIHRPRWCKAAMAISTAQPLMAARRRQRHGIPSDDQRHVDDPGFVQRHQWQPSRSRGWCKAAMAVSTARPSYGGTNGNYGTVFQMTPAGALTTLVSFNGTNGSYPYDGAGARQQWQFLRHNVRAVAQAATARCLK